MQNHDRYFQGHAILYCAASSSPILNFAFLVLSKGEFVLLLIFLSQSITAGMSTSAGSSLRADVDSLAYPKDHA
jgi:hypothetical protein